MFGVATCVWLAGGFLLPSRLVANNTPPHASVDRTGELRVMNGMTLHLNADLGNVRIQTLPPGAPPVLRYTVHIETDAPAPEGQKLLDYYSLTTRETVDTVFVSGAVPNLNALVAAHRTRGRNVQFYVQFVVTVPATFSVDVSTGLGDIETSDIGGRVCLLTQGGNITAGRIGMEGPALARGDRPVAKIETQGGHITLRDVAGDLDAYTAGGHILAGNIDGNARLHTGGGHIRAARIKGTARLESDAGGNISVGEAGAYVTVRTSGGQIDFGEVHGSVHAETGGGGIRVISVAGPMEVASNGGSICLTRVANRVRAETGEGTITAWINPEAPGNAPVVRLPGPSQLASHTGDIVVFLPRNIAMNIDATVESGGPGRIEADPSLPLNIQAQPNGPVHVMASLNGGGALLKLHTTAGKIQLQYLDAQATLRQALQDEEKQRLAERFSEYQASPVSMTNRTAPQGNAPPELSANDLRDDWFDSARKRFEVIFMGSIREDNKDFTKRLIVSPPPEYPALAESAGLQGRVVLQLRVKADGSVSVEKVLEGQPALVDAATAAVQKWRAKPEQINGKNVEVVSTFSFEFQLRH
ncbi:MAG TPA: TonB family protein [Candidatus Acidoferrum sp.]|nr:TonB family protein [Candidatus Acidoferrum sp.]